MTHLKTKWVMFNTLQIEEMVSNYTQGWHIDGHFAMFKVYLDSKHTTPFQDTITVSDVDKN